MRLPPPLVFCWRGHWPGTQKYPLVGASVVESCRRIGGLTLNEEGAHTYSSGGGCKATRVVVVADEGPRLFVGVAIPLKSLPGGGTPIFRGVSGVEAYAFSTAAAVVSLVPRAERGRGNVGVVGATKLSVRWVPVRTLSRGAQRGRPSGYFGRRRSGAKGGGQCMSWSSLLFTSRLVGEAARVWFLPGQAGGDILPCGLELDL